MNYKEITLDIAPKPLPFTEINGVRPAMSFTANLIEEFLEKYEFIRVDNNDYSLRRDNILNFTININAEKWPSLFYNYAVIRIDQEILYCFIQKITPLQNNVNQLLLKVDVVSTYFWKLDGNTLIGVDRLNYNIQRNKELLLNTLSQKDDTIISLPKTYYIIPEAKDKLKLSHYSRREYTSNEISQNLDPHKFIIDYPKIFSLKPEFNNGYITSILTKGENNLELESNKVYYNFLSPQLSSLFLSFVNEASVTELHKFDANNYRLTYFNYARCYKRDSYGSTCEEELDEIFNINTLPDAKLGSLDKDYYLLKYEFSIECETHHREETFRASIGFKCVGVNGEGVNIRDIFSKIIDNEWIGKNIPTIDLDRFLEFSHCKINYKRITTNLKDNWISGYNGEGYDIPPRNWIIHYNGNQHSIMQGKFVWPFKEIPPIKEIADFKVKSWTGSEYMMDNLEITWLWNLREFMSENEVTYNYYGYQLHSLITAEKYKTFLGINEGIKHPVATAIDNNIELELSKPLYQRYDSKTEYLSSNLNSIQTEQNNALKDMLLGLFSGIANIALSPLSINPAASATNGIFGAISSGINYSNRIATIEARIEDVGNSRSSFKSSEGDVAKLSHFTNTEYFNSKGTAFMMILPIKNMWKTLINHYYKFGCKLNTYLKLEDTMLHTQHNKNFTYLRVSDTSSLYNHTEIPNEALRYLDDILKSGVHFWKYNTAEYDIVRLTKYDGEFKLDRLEIGVPNYWFGEGILPLHKTEYRK